MHLVRSSVLLDHSIKCIRPALYLAIAQSHTAVLCTNQVRPVLPSKLVDDADAILTDYCGARAAERGMYEPSIRPPPQPLWRWTKFTARLCFYIIAPMLYLILHERGGGRCSSASDVGFETGNGCVEVACDAAALAMYGVVRDDSAVSTCAHLPVR